MISRRRYELLRRLATGGMAEVWEARALEGPHAGRRVALKRVLAALSDDPALGRMLRDEARIVAAMRHPNIVSALDSGAIEGAYFIAFELVGGIDAARALSLGARGGGVAPFSEDVALYIVESVARALDHAHSLAGVDGAGLGIVHRDVCPGNILLSWEGHVLLADFGIARGAHRTERTATGQVKGTTGYMAPEQILGDAVTQAADVFAVGATLHALLAQAPPLSSWRATSAYIGGGELPIAPGIRDEVADLVRRCSDVDAARRPRAALVADTARALRSGATASGAVELAAALAPIRELVERRGPLDDLLAGIVDERTTALLETDEGP